MEHHGQERRTSSSSVSTLASDGAAWNTSPGGDALRSAFFPSDSSVKLIRRFNTRLSDIKLVTGAMGNQEGKAWVEVVASLACDGANKEAPLPVPFKSESISKPVYTTLFLSA
jgi:hypothetical protein